METPNLPKQEIRRQALTARQAKPDRDAASRIIWKRFAAMPEYTAAETVLFYVNMRDEVDTGQALADAMAAGKRVAVPYCDGPRLRLYHLSGMDELAPGTLGILEPKPDLRAAPGRGVEIEQVDLVMVPGVAFDRHGGRLGHGRGYYDRLLSRARADTLLAGVAFECQVFSRIPMLPHDVFMDRLVTEQGLSRGNRRSTNARR